MAPIRTGVHIQGADFMAVWKGGKDIAELSYLPQNATEMLHQLAWWPMRSRRRANSQRFPLPRRQSHVVYDHART
jgi:hypothetical protein